ncbi:ATP-binding protein [Persicitalea sp.]|uniref:sensor histidine kinase n=1 Tax=Persicitalea sp. TaxID=3100273 RepID=UPI003593FF84
MRKIPILPALIFWLSLSPASYSQDDLKSEDLITSQSLSSNSVWSICQDREGIMLWIGTIDGLNRYDGYSFKTFRADAIVRGMLEHARSTPGERQPTDLNALADEYLRLAYQGVRAKDSTFTCALETDFDPDLGRVGMVAADLGRVLLNLYDNAFHAQQQKRVKANVTYMPTVWLSTRRQNGSVELLVRDNGTGIPPGIVGKIFQPFFTTKPTGQGIGLGFRAFL